FNSSSGIQADSQIIKTEAVSEKVLLAKEVHRINDTDRQIARLTGRNLGPAGYILSLEGAMAYLNYIKQSSLSPLDGMMFRDFIHASNVIFIKLQLPVVYRKRSYFPRKKMFCLVI